MIKMNLVNMSSIETHGGHSHDHENTAHRHLNQISESHNDERHEDFESMKSLNSASNSEQSHSHSAIGRVHKF